MALQGTQRRTKGHNTISIVTSRNTETYSTANVRDGGADSSSPPALLTANIFRKHELYYSLQKTLGKFGPCSAAALVASASSELSRN